MSDTCNVPDAGTVVLAVVQHFRTMGTRFYELVRVDSDAPQQQVAQEKTMLTAFFVVLVGTQAPVGFTIQDVACEYAVKTKGTIFQGGNYVGGIVSEGGTYARMCYAVDNGCEMAMRDIERRATPMSPVKCSKETESVSHWRIIQEGGR